MKRVLVFPIVAGAVFLFAALAYCESPTPQQSPTPTATHRVYEFPQDKALHDLIADASTNFYADHAINKNGIAMSQPDPVLLRFMKERAVAGESVEPAETAYAVPGPQEQ